MPTAVLLGVEEWEVLPPAVLLRAHPHSLWISAGRGPWGVTNLQQGQEPQWCPTPQQHWLPQGIRFGLYKTNRLGGYKRSMSKHVNYNCPFR